MKMTIDVTSRAEGDAIRRALTDPTMKTANLIAGALLDLPRSERVQVLGFVGAILDALDRGAGRPTLDALRLHDGGNGSAAGTTGD